MDKEIKELLTLIDKEIATHEAALSQLRKMRVIWGKHELPKMKIINEDQPLTRDFIRSFLKDYKQPIRTIDIINMLYSSRNEEDKYNLTKHLAVMLNQMTKSGELLAENVAGVKGNFYTLNTK